MSRSAPRPLPTWAILVFFALIVVISWWQTHEAGPRAPVPELGARPVLPAGTVSPDPGDPAIDPPVTSDRADDMFETPLRPDRARTPSDSATAKSETPPPARVENQVIRRQDGVVLFRGTVDLQPTLDRIQRGERHPHRNDGAIFQNRERRLPAHPAGYYREYVHPTPGDSGPGPQRVILGRGGDVWYTPDHYRTFRRIERSPSAAPARNLP